MDDMEWKKRTTYLNYQNERKTPKNLKSHVLRLN